MVNNEIIVDKKDNVLTITLNRPKVLNALNENIKDAMLNALLTAEKDNSLGAIMISGNGKSFSAGGDIKAMMKEPNQLETINYLELTKELIMQMSKIEIPIITAIHGKVAGGGACLALASDIIFASIDCELIFSFSKIGLIPDNGGLFFLPHTVGMYRAKEILFEGGSISATKANEWGLINRLYPKEELLKESMNYAQKIAKGPKLAIGKIKKLVNLPILNDLETTLELEKFNQTILRDSEDHKEGINAFLEKRKPIFTGN